MCRVLGEAWVNFSLVFMGEKRSMTHALAPALTIARRAVRDPLEYARVVVVSACALALIAAGQMLPL